MPGRNGTADRTSFAAKRAPTAFPCGHQGFTPLEAGPHRLTRTRYSCAATGPERTGPRAPRRARQPWRPSPTAPMPQAPRAQARTSSTSALTARKRSGQKRSIQDPTNSNQLEAADPDVRPRASAPVPHPRAAPAKVRWAHSSGPSLPQLGVKHITAVSFPERASTRNHLQARPDPRSAVACGSAASTLPAVRQMVVKQRSGGDGIRSGPASGAAHNKAPNAVKMIKAPDPPPKTRRRRPTKSEPPAFRPASLNNGEPATPLRKGQMCASLGRGQHQRICASLALASGGRPPNMRDHTTVDHPQAADAPALALAAAADRGTDPQLRRNSRGPATQSDHSKRQQQRRVRHRHPRDPHLATGRPGGGPIKNSAHAARFVQQADGLQAVTLRRRPQPIPQSHRPATTASQTRPGLKPAPGNDVAHSRKAAPRQAGA